MKRSKLIAVAMTSVLVITTLCGCGATSHERKTFGTITDTDNGAAGSNGVELTMVVASNQTSQDNPYHYGLETFKEVVEELSGGTIQVECSDGDRSEDEAELLNMLDKDEILPAVSVFPEIWRFHIPDAAVKYLLQKTAFFFPQ